MTGIKRLTPRQSRKVNTLVKKECCNCENGNCILLDDGDTYCSLIGLLVASPLCPAREFVIEAAGKINFTAPLTMVGAYAGISISDQLKEFAKQGWKMLLIAALVMIGTFTCSAIIAQIILSMTHVI